MFGVDILFGATKALSSKLPPSILQIVKGHVYPESIPEGEAAPQFHLEDQHGTTHVLEQEWTLIAFYPGDDTPGCSEQLADVEAHREEFAKYGCKVIGINSADASSHAAFAKRLGLGFPLLVDTGNAVGKQYRAVTEVAGVTIPIRTIFLINPAHKIRLANRGSPSLKAILRSIHALQTASRTGM
jgi:peroxiredoxin Q/BCP